MSKIVFQVVGTIVAVAIGAVVGSAAAAATDDRRDEVSVIIMNEGTSGEVQ